MLENSIYVKIPNDAKKSNTRLMKYKCNNVTD